MFWSQPKPCANIIGGPSGTPESLTLFLVKTTIEASGPPAAPEAETSAMM